LRGLVVLVAMEGFYKTENCPSSEELLSFQTGEIDLAGSAKVRRHLFVCEFCDTEVNFYELYPPGELETVETDTIPDPLFQLACELLQKDRDLAPLYRLVARG
jgi:hypothetical protein